MIEAMMYVAIGLLLGGLLGIAVIPLIHRRAVRLTERRLEAALPQSMKEVQAYKDGLRAEFAVAARQLEMRNERLLEQAARQFVLLSKRDDTIKALRAQIDATRIESPSVRIEVPSKGQIEPLRGGNTPQQRLSMPAKSSERRLVRSR